MITLKTVHLSGEAVKMVLLALIGLTLVGILLALVDVGQKLDTKLESSPMPSLTPSVSLPMESIEPAPVVTPTPSASASAKAVLKKP